MVVVVVMAFRIPRARAKPSRGRWVEWTQGQPPFRYGLLPSLPQAPAPAPSAAEGVINVR